MFSNVGQILAEPALPHRERERGRAHLPADHSRLPGISSHIFISVSAGGLWAVLSCPASWEMLNVGGDEERITSGRTPVQSNTT